jgi:type I restriction enzyme S subunit
MQAQFTKGTNSTTQGAFGIKKFRLLKIPTPSIIEQNQIVREVESRLSVCDAVEESIVTSLEKAHALRQSILKKAFEGKLLSEQEIAACKAHKDYEPASLLLERIKEEKMKK